MHTFDTVCPVALARLTKHFVHLCVLFKDDIFSPSTVKAVTKAPHKSKKTPVSQETSTAVDSSNIFDDPLNALGGN